MLTLSLQTLQDSLSFLEMNDCFINFVFLSARLIKGDALEDSANDAASSLIGLDRKMTGRDTVGQTQDDHDRHASDEREKEGIYLINVIVSPLVIVFTRDSALPLRGGRRKGKGKKESEGGTMFVQLKLLSPRCIFL